MAPSPTLPSDIIGSRKVQFLNRQESLFPHLLRLSMDFSFHVLELLSNSPEKGKQYTLAADDFFNETNAVTPLFSSLHELNQHVGEQMVDILHDYLFGLQEEDAHPEQSYA
ncbi:hypothetical protein [Pseudomaricurvus sp.]|uniref:hypothetical protein n=1 Tax=Pseudomaricurvus sp. TaxID=2004510 RepID=UPI003F6C62B4